MDENKLDIATREELDQLIADREKDPPIPEYNYPKPSWIEDSGDTDRAWMRMRERRINHLEKRLDNASRTMRHDFENQQEIE
ncbi:hypothetical protein SAMN04488056_105255 [Cohaesibacter marisflavi]|uniref:Uncharacterized protein n=1 Tax=Cohaesibacter marisflavi TaxID=655353 RepID=A0A1I5GXZ0_9HYPH|nr:hypothetical protein [Cohaesibacter marisflavi]SFO40872.1 hypothetical protein SAMN04488056_105255 [Cohaesibacter marisflavi]